MSPRIGRFYARTAVAGMAVLILGAGCYFSGVRVNTTRSIPLGLYWLTSDPIEKGAFVAFCPPASDVFDVARQRGYIGAGLCPGGYGLMFKQVLAAKADHIDISPRGVAVNGNALPNSTPMVRDLAGQPLPGYLASDYTLGEHEVLLMSETNGKSFDGRYFGPVSTQQIQGAIRPVFTW